MPDRYEPKLTVRPPGERKAPEPVADADPLAELARIVSGRAPAEAPAPRAKAGAPAAEPDIERDLEAELLNDLQASFAALSDPLDAAPAEEAEAGPEADPEPLPPPLPAAPARAAERPPEPKPEPPARRQPEPFSFDISQALDEAEAAAARVVRAEQAKRAEPPREPRPYAPPLRGPAASPRTDAARNDAPARMEPAPRAAPPAPRPAASRGEATPGTAPRRAPPAPRAERTSIPVRPLPMDDDLHAAEAPPPRQVTPRPPRTEPPAPPSSRFAPNREVAVAPPPPPRRAVAPEPAAERYDDDLDLDLVELPDDLDGPYEDDFTLDDLDTAAYADDEFPPFPEDRAAGGRRRSGRVFAVVAGMLAIVAVGGAAVFLYRGDEGSSGGPPPIIAAEQGPTKVAPEATGDTATESDSQSKLIYDRVADASDGQDTRLVTDQPEIGSIPADDGVDASNPISRVIIPGGPTDNSDAFPDVVDAGPAGTDENGIPRPPADDEAADSIGPRMVRTVVVKPDGTIVSSEATGVDENGNALPGQDQAEIALAEPAIPPPPRSEMDAVLEGGNLSVNTDPLSAPGSREEPAMATPEPVIEAPAPAAIQPAPVAAAPEPQPEAAPAPAPPPAQRETQVATRNSDGPIDLTPGTAPAGGAQTAGGSALVQVTAQRSEEAATSAYRSLQRKFPSILGAFQPKIVRADLGDKGVFYRVRVGPFSNGDAARLCADLKAAGGDCMTVR